MTRIVAIEEHLVVPEVLAAWSRMPAGRHHSDTGGAGSDLLSQRLRDVGDRRLAEVDDPVDLFGGTTTLYTGSGKTASLFLPTVLVRENRIRTALDERPGLPTK